MQQNFKILVVEDDPFIAMDMQAAFEDAGCQIIGVVPTNRAALEILEKIKPDLATVDYNLGSETSAPTAKILFELSIPFIYISGRPDCIRDDKEMPNAPILSKPVSIQYVLDIFLTQQN